MKKLVVTFLVVSALLISLSPAFAWTSATPALPDPRIATENGMFSDSWFAQGLSGSGG